VSGSSGANNAAAGVITIIGKAIGGVSGSGVLNASTGSITVTRAVGNGFGPGSIGLTAAVGVANSALGVASVEELEYGTLGMSPTSGAAIRLKKLTSNVAIFNYADTVGSKTLVDATQGQMPAITDVRFGTSYASGALTGVAYIPSAGSVAFGVPVDNTTGTAVLTASAIFDTLTSTMTTSGSIGERLANASTVAVTGQQITSALG
jgi:hypothetical protein